MKKILITGAGSYIGTSFENYIKEAAPEGYAVDTVDTLDAAWGEKSFAGYDCVFHVAGIAHQKETEENAPLYYQVNRDLAIQVAQKAKAEGVSQLVLLSSMSVYGMDTGVITKETLPNPRSHYGKSKWEAEQAIAPMEAEGFQVCILRPPMVYGKGCKGNFGKIRLLVEKSPVFPYVKNQRSMIYIDNLCEFVKLCVDRSLSGVYFPQNREYVSTVDMARGIARGLDRKILFGRLTGLAVAGLRLFLPVAQKAFGSLVYSGTEEFDYCYIVRENGDSFLRSV